jgi:hypothetical protein
VSYILDALKRSEQERHQGELTPTAVDTIMFKAKPVKHQWWPYLLILILLINLCVYVYFQLSRDQQAVIEIVSVESIEEQTEQLNQAAISGQPAQRELRSGQQSMSSRSLTPSDAIRPSGNPGITGESSVKALPEHVLQTPILNRQFDLNQMHSDASGKAVRQASTPKTNGAAKPSAVEQTIEYDADGFEVIRPKQGSAQPAPLITASAQVSTVDELPETRSIPENFELIEPSRGHSRIDAKPERIAVAHPQESNVADHFETIPHLSDLSAVFQASIPDIRFNSHIYSGQPSERRVMINDLYLREGQSFSGMKIQQIGEFYIELEKQNQRFKLPVLRDWFSPR